MLAWKEITDLAKNKQGIAVALSLPEDDEHQIKDKVFDQIFLDHLKSDFGLNILIAFLDKNLEKNDLASVEKSMILMILGEKMISQFTNT